MKRLALYVVAISIFAMSFASGYVYAQSKNSVLFVAPNRVLVKDGERIKEVVVNNKSDRARRYDITVLNQVMNSEGYTERVDDFEYAAKPMLRFVPKRFTLEPGERQIVRVMVRRPKDLADGDYHSHMLFREVPLKAKTKEDLIQQRQGEASFEIRALYGIAVPVVVQQGVIESSIELADAKFLNRDSLVVSFNRAGNAEAAAMLVAEYMGSGKPVDIIQKQWVRIYREADRINKIVELKVPDGVNLQAGADVVVSLVQPDGENQDKVTILQSKTIKVQ